MPPWLVMAAALIGSPEADPPAEPQVRVALLPLVTEGTLDQGIAARVRTQLEEGIARGGVALVDPTEISRVAPTPCTEPSCAAAIAEATGARYVVRPHLVHRDRVYTIELELLDAHGRSLARNRNNCDICGLEEVAEVAGDQAALLYAKLEALARPPTAMRIDSTPAGARVSLDGEPVGATPLLREVTPGLHVLRVELDGYVVEQRQIDASEGVEQELTLALTALPTAPPQQVDRARVLVPLGAASLGVGAVLAIGGAVLIALDGRQYQRRCSGDDVDIEGTCRYSYDTLGGGATALSLGLAATGAGIAMLIVGKRPRERVRVAASARGVVLHGRF